jgi:hypothetical protein
LEHLGKLLEVHVGCSYLLEARFHDELLSVQLVVAGGLGAVSGGRYLAAAEEVPKLPRRDPVGLAKQFEE